MLILKLFKSISNKVEVILEVVEVNLVVNFEAIKANLYYFEAFEVDL